jgi:hypothetical protein
VNDVYAYLATGVQGGVWTGANGTLPPPTQFPTNMTELNQITTFAASHGITFPDANALAIVVKSSWVLASSIPNLQDYVTTTANVLTYKQVSPNNLWVPSGLQTVQLALIGVNFFGSANGHPEGIWVSFEHMANAPRGDYTYIDTSGANVTVSQALGTTNWVLTTNNSPGPYNTQHMGLAPAMTGQGSFGSQPTIDSAGAFTISPSDTIRWKAFGAASDGPGPPNPLVASAAASNTQIISINNSIIGQLISPDVRANYVMTGATWTIGGAAPGCSFQLGIMQSNGTLTCPLSQFLPNTLANIVGTRLAPVCWPAPPPRPTNKGWIPLSQTAVQFASAATKPISSQ